MGWTMHRAVLGMFLCASLAGCAEAAETVGGLTPPPPAVPLSTPAETAQPAPVQIDRAAFERWLVALREEALGRGISAATVTAALSDVEPLPRVLELDRRQPEFSQTFWSYVGRGVSDQRVAKGRDMLARHGTLLGEVERTYGVQARFLVAFWGLETNFGANFGGFPVIGALATLAFDERRAEFFRAELFKALEILDADHIAPQRMVGSWAGAMGHLQFMPSTFRAHAVDRDGDGHIDIWNSLPDTFASAAKYLSDEGWNGDQTWGREVRLPKGFDVDLADLSVRKPLAEWAALGVTRAGGGALPVVAGMEGSIVLPAGAGGPAFLVYDNFRVIMKWNRSVLYALAVGHLADKLIGLPDLVAKPTPGERPLSRAEMLEIQSLLNRLGYPAGEPDGIAGSRTRAALKAFQKAQGRVPDAYPDVAALQALRQAAGG